jgi:hypothetical protein
VLNLSFSANSDFEESIVLRTLQENNYNLRVMINIACMYSGYAARDVAEARLAVWYIAEMFADHGEVTSVMETELADGSGDVEFLVQVRADMAIALIEKLAWLAPVFDLEVDGDGINAFDFGCEIIGWAEEQVEKPSRFPALRDAYESDLAVALELEAEDDATASDS